MTPPNPSGENGGTFVPEPAYGAVKRLDDNKSQAPLAGQGRAASALNAPRRAGQAAKRGDRAAPVVPQEPAATGPYQPSQEGPSYEEQVAAEWARLAEDPKASPLIKQYALESAKLAGLED